MSNAIYTPKQNYKVLVNTITYNQAKYITDTLDGVAMQQTNFPFVHYVIDDCSTDGEQEVIKSWLNDHCDMDNAEYIDLELANVILVPHKKNRNLTFAIYFLKRNLWKEQELKETLILPWRDHCEYEALCEGDDYWTHPEKLQRQVDFMDTHPECSMCFSNCKLLNDSNLSTTISVGKIEDRLYSADEINKTWCIPTASVLYRTEVNDYPLIKPERLMYGDIALFLKAQKKGKVMGFSDTMTVYRVNPGSITQNASSLKYYHFRKPDHIQCLIDNFGDILDMQYMKLRLFDSYWERLFKQKTLSDKFMDLLKVFSMNPCLTVRYCIRTIGIKFALLIKIE